jgi:hypothetical protein
VFFANGRQAPAVEPGLNRRRSSMQSRTTLRGLGIAVALSGVLVAACVKSDRQIVVVDGDKTEFVAFGAPPKGPQEIWVPGRTLIFRTDASVPGGPGPGSGKAGHVYRVNDKKELEEIGKFDLKIPNDTLAYRFGS